MADVNRLSTQVTDHTVFEENQVLTSEQLNQLTGYLDRQQRLTRARLHGIGVVCGLEPQRIGTNIRVSKGVALTSDGDLLNLEQAQTFTQFKVFTDMDAQYPHFRVEETGMPLFELVAKGGTPLGNFAADTGQDLSNMVALLYLESYFYDPDLCTGSGCDNKGKEARNNLKVLLVDAENAELLLGDENYLGRRYPLLEPYKMPRPILDPDNINNYTDLTAEYLQVASSALTDLKGRLQNTWQPLIRTLLADMYGKVNPTLRWGQILDALGAEVTQHKDKEMFAVQYLFDFLHDLAHAYEEFREALFADNVICTPPVELFPKHVLLGGVGNNSLNRHGFYESPQLNHKDKLVAKIRFLHKRIDQMLRLFRLPTATSTVRITPSLSCGSELGSRAVPYYYRASATQPLTGNWSFELSQRGLQKGIYSYHAGALGGTAEAKEPLKYDFCPYDFFRIEGHLGGNVETVETELKKQIDDYNLPIKVLVLQIETALKPWRVRPLAPMRDLKALHRFHRMDLLQQVANIRDFSFQVRSTVQSSTDLPEKDVEADSLSYGKFLKINLGVLPGATATGGTTGTGSATGTEETLPDGSEGVLLDAISQVDQRLKVNFKQFQPLAFKDSYKSMVKLASGVNKSIRGVTHASSFTPYEQLQSDSKFKWLDWIGEVLNKRQERAEELSVFAKFLKEAPALEHLGGVPKGGTFILVYSASLNRVVADFSLPYWHVDVPEAEEEELEIDDQKLQVLPDFKWHKLNDFVVKRAKTKVLTEELSKLKDDFRDFKPQIMLSKGGGDDVQFTDPELGAQGALLKQMARYMDSIDLKAASGTATAEEIGMRNQVENVSSGIIKTRIKEFQQDSSDITPGSDQDKFMDIAVAASTSMRAAEKQALSEDMTEIKNDSGGKTYMESRLKSLIVK